jgi:hypothetical protein
VQFIVIYWLLERSARHLSGGVQYLDMHCCCCLQNVFMLLMGCDDEAMDMHQLEFYEGPGAGIY